VEASHEASLMKLGVLKDDRIIVLQRVIPNIRVHRITEHDVSDVDRIRVLARRGDH